MLQVHDPVDGKHTTGTVYLWQKVREGTVAAAMVLTGLYDQTKDVKQTQQAAGHANASTTMKYHVKGRAEHANTAAAIAAVYGVN